MTTHTELQQTLAEMVLEGKGILAADESALTIESVNSCYRRAKQLKHPGEVT